MSQRFILVVCLLMATPLAAQDEASSPPVPRQYVAYRSDGAVQVDGQLNEQAWRATPWTTDFVDIQGAAKPTPRFRTHAKMLWDSTYFYVGGRLEEPHLWATLTERDAVLFHEDNFEVFIDPDGDTHNYYELEINALQTVWDLMLLKPYRDGGPAIEAWDIRGLKAAVTLDGSLNQPKDRDQGWTVELALPWAVLKEAAPGGRPPKDGDQWRVNFSRVEWHTTASEGAYRKQIDPKTNKPLPADNWVWSPQGAINMHRPEHWGYVQFSNEAADKGADAFVKPPNERVKRALRQLYYRQRRFYETHGQYASQLGQLNASEVTVDGLDFAPRLWTADNMYVISAPGFEGHTVYIRHDGKIWMQ